MDVPRGECTELGVRSRVKKLMPRPEQTYELAEKCTPPVVVNERPRDNAGSVYRISNGFCRERARVILARDKIVKYWH